MIHMICFDWLFNEAVDGVGIQVYLCFPPISVNYLKAQISHSFRYPQAGITGKVMGRRNEQKINQAAIPDLKELTFWLESGNYWGVENEKGYRTALMNGSETSVEGHDHSWNTFQKRSERSLCCSHVKNFATCRLGRIITFFNHVILPSVGSTQLS